MDAAKIVGDEMNRGHYAENVLKYFLEYMQPEVFLEYMQLDSLAAKIHIANFRDDIQKKDSCNIEQRKTCSFYLLNWRQKDLQKYLSLS